MMKEFKKQEFEIFKRLFDKEWNGEKIWRHIQNGNLIATPAFEGEMYKTAKTKVMFVGRALNGWEKELGNCSNLENTVYEIANQYGDLDTFIDENGFGDGKRKYRHKNSKFFRFIKHVLEILGESDWGIDETWYTDSKKWNQKFVWANLYCIAPKKPKQGESGNPDNKLMKVGVNEYVDLVELYVNHYKPDVVVFITDISGWFVRWKTLKSFKCITQNYEEISNSETIVATGNIGESKVIVCKRPDSYKKTYANVAEMAEDVALKVREVVSNK